MFHFTIRDLLWATTLAAMGIAWGVHWHRLSNEAAYHKDRSAYYDFMFRDRLKGVDFWGRE